MSPSVIPAHNRLARSTIPVWLSHDLWLERVVSGNETIITALSASTVVGEGAAAFFNPLQLMCSFYLIESDVSYKESSVVLQYFYIMPCLHNSSTCRFLCFSALFICSVLGLQNFIFPKCGKSGNGYGTSHYALSGKFRVQYLYQSVCLSGLWFVPHPEFFTQMLLKSSEEKPVFNFNIS